MNFINNRLRRLEERAGGGPCPECAGAKGIAVTYGDDPAQSCQKCGRTLTIIRVVYEGDEEGEGDTYWLNARA